ncbi:MAG TPA: carbohydrate ABC transporter permease [Spirochaetia bacterium]|nr:carbohydrate ABC transporter permease [Spirochaetia bacterium]
MTLESRKKPFHPGRIILYALLSLSALYFLVPVYVLLVTGLKSFKDVNLERMWSFPSQVSPQTFLQAFEKLAPNLGNSFRLTVPATLISAALGSLNGYVLSKWRFRGANLIFPFLLFGMFIPYQSILIPLVQFLSSIKLYGKLTGLIVVHIIYGIPITTLIFRNYYAEIPDELLEASFMDGNGFFGSYLRILLPISAPGFVVVVIWQFTNIWNEFLFAVTITQKPSLQPVTVALQNLAGSQIVEWNVQMAGALIAALPTLIIYIALGKFFIGGLLAGSVKS